MYEMRIAEGYNETYLHETDGGELLAFMRPGGEVVTHTFVSRSGDGGGTWSEPVALCKGYPACAVRLGSGRILLAYGYRFKEGQGVRARLLSEGGEPVGEECILRDDGVTFDLGYPKACLLPDGRALVVYYINRRADAPDATAPRYIEGCVLEARGKEPWRYA